MLTNPHRVLLEVGSGAALTRLAEAALDRERREASPMFYATEPFLLECDHELAIAYEYGGHVTVVCVDPEDVHDWISYAVPPAVPMSRCVRLSYKSFICRPTRAQS